MTQGLLAIALLVCGGYVYADGYDIPTNYEELLERIEDLEKTRTKIEELNDPIEKATAEVQKIVEDTKKNALITIEEFEAKIAHEKKEQMRQWQEFLDWQDTYGFGGSSWDHRYYNDNIDALEDKHKTLWHRSGVKVFGYNHYIETEQRFLESRTQRAAKEASEKLKKLTVKRKNLVHRAACLESIIGEAEGRL